jgi:acyl-CoA synthetase (AMP-forming)/AMP-acid ligase II
MTSLYNGNQVDMLPKFNAETVWSKLLDVNSPVNVFYGVPTVYVHLVNAYLSNPDFQAKYSSDRIKEIFKQKMRLLVCGSAPLNVKTYKQWTDITGYKLLDRYGMTE